MRYVSLFSGIEAASVAWLPLGWRIAGIWRREHSFCDAQGEVFCIAASLLYPSNFLCMPRYLLRVVQWSIDS